MEERKNTTTTTRPMPTGTGRITTVETESRTHSVPEIDSRAQVQRLRIVAINVVWFICGIVAVLLGLRFVLEVLGANPGNPFAVFIYSLTAPMTAPFNGLFGYTLVYGRSQFDLYAILAMAIYALIALGIVKLITITQTSR